MRKGNEPFNPDIHPCPDWATEEIKLRGQQIINQSADIMILRVQLVFANKVIDAVRDVVVHGGPLLRKLRVALHDYDESVKPAEERP